MQPPSPYGYPPPSQGYQGGYAPAPPQRNGLGAVAIILIVLGGLGAFGGGCVVCVIARSPAAKANAEPAREFVSVALTRAFLRCAGALAVAPTQAPMSRVDETNHGIHGTTSTYAACGVSSVIVFAASAQEQGWMVSFEYPTAEPFIAASDGRDEEFRLELDAPNARRYLVMKGALVTGTRVEYDALHRAVMMKSALWQQVEAGGIQVGGGGTTPTATPRPAAPACAGCKCNDGSCGCCGRGCCSHHGGIAGG